MSSAKVYEVMVEYTEQRCSPSPSTSSSASSSAPCSGAASPSNSVSSSSSSSNATSRRIRRLSKTKKSSAVCHSLRRASRKFISAGRTKFAKRHSSVSASKLRLVKYKIDKKHEEKMAASRARVERLRREREELLAGRSQLAVLCESVTTGARSLRESYDRQRAVFHAYISEALYEVAEQVIQEEEDEEVVELGAGFIGSYFY